MTDHPWGQHSHDCEECALFRRNFTKASRETGLTTHDEIYSRAVAMTKFQLAERERLAQEPPEPTAEDLKAETMNNVFDFPSLPKEPADDDVDGWPRARAEFSVLAAHFPLGTEDRAFLEGLLEYIGSTPPISEAQAWQYRVGSVAANEILGAGPHRVAVTALWSVGSMIRVASNPIAVSLTERLRSAIESANLYFNGKEP